MSFYHGTNSKNGNSILAEKRFIAKDEFCLYGEGVYFYPIVKDCENYIKKQLQEDGYILEADVDISTFNPMKLTELEEIFMKTNTTPDLLEAKTTRKNYRGVGWKEHFIKEGNKGLIVYDGNDKLVEYVVYDIDVISNIRVNKKVNV